MENELPIFTAALGIEEPWFVRSVKFSQQEDGQKVLHIEVDHTARSLFAYEETSYPVYDHQPRSWRHLNFFQHHCYLHARVPRVRLGPDGLVKLVEVPWARPGSSFTLLFEDDVIALLQQGMSNSAIGKRLGIGDKRVFGIARHRVSTALSEQHLESVEELSVDETSSRKGHNYFTILADRTAKKVVGVAIGKDKEAFAEALVDMEIRGAYRQQVKAVTMDMSTSYIAAVNEWMAQAAIVFDRFHLVKKLNEAVDQVRRTEQRQFKELKNSRYLWLRNQDDLSLDQQGKMETLAAAYPRIGTAHRLKELFREVLDEAHRTYNLTALENWIKLAWDSEIPSLRAFVDMLNTHWYGVETYFTRLSSNAFAERVNLKVQEIKRLAKGYRNSYNFSIMIYFHLGGLNLLTH
jgi:transposase